MKIFIKYYQNLSIGICKADSLNVPNNKITVGQLKDILYERYRIDPSQQRLTTKIADTTIVFINKIIYLGNYDKRMAIIFLLHQRKFKNLSRIYTISRQSKFISI